MKGGASSVPSRLLTQTELIRVFARAWNRRGKLMQIVGQDSMQINIVAAELCPWGSSL